MKKDMLPKLKICLLALVSLLVSACSLDLLDNPNAVTTNNTDINYLLSRIELDYADHFNQMGNSGMRLTRMAVLAAGAALLVAGLLLNLFLHLLARDSLVEDMRVQARIAELWERIHAHGRDRQRFDRGLHRLLDGFAKELGLRD